MYVMGRRKQSEEERIRGRKWVSLFTSLSYSFQADADADHIKAWLISEVT